MMKNRALLLDRDGVINVDSGYVGSREAFAFLPGVFPFLRAARALGFRLAVLTNQAGVARGLYTEKDYADVMAHMQEGLARESIDIELMLAAFAHPAAQEPAYAYQSYWRKPNPGMVLEAVRKLTLDPARCAFLGDALTDMQAAAAGGIGRCLWLTQEPCAPEGVEIVRAYDDALAILKGMSA